VSFVDAVCSDSWKNEADDMKTKTLEIECQINATGDLLMTIECLSNDTPTLRTTSRVERSVLSRITVRTNVSDTTRCEVFVARIGTSTGKCPNNVTQKIFNWSNVISTLPSK
jgi:hypothetical protein